MAKKEVKKHNVASLTITNCRQCPFHSQERYYTSDSFETAFNWYCTKKRKKKVAGYVEWHEEKDVQIPDWCPILK